MLTVILTFESQRNVFVIVNIWQRTVGREVCIE